MKNDLEKEGWEKRFTTFGTRLKEAVELFEELGFEVKLEEAEKPDNLPDDSCEKCFSQLERTIYVRPKG